MLGVAGGSGSGKTTVAERLEELLGPESLVLVRLDSYYRTRDDLPLAERERMNYDHPDAFDWALLVHHVRTLCAGLPVAASSGRKRTYCPGWREWALAV